MLFGCGRRAQRGLAETEEEQKNEKEMEISLSLHQDPGVETTCVSCLSPVTLLNPQRSEGGRREEKGRK